MSNTTPSPSDNVKICRSRHPAWGNDWKRETITTLSRQLTSDPGLDTLRSKDLSFFSFSSFFFRWFIKGKGKMREAEGFVLCGCFVCLWVRECCTGPNSLTHRTPEPKKDEWRNFCWRFPHPPHQDHSDPSSPCSGRSQTPFQSPSPSSPPPTILGPFLLFPDLLKLNVSLTVGRELMMVYDSDSNVVYNRL